MMVNLEIRDTGPGLDEKDFSKIFTPFFTTKEDGSGLGLAIVNPVRISRGALNPVLPHGAFLTG